MTIQAALIDMDGTLLGRDQVRVSERNMSALSALNARGIHVIPCTGRVADMLPPQILEAPFIRYVVSCHGAALYDQRERRTLYRNALSPAESARVIECFEGRGLYAEVAANNTIYIEKAIEARLACPPVPPHHMWYMCERRAYTAAHELSAYVARVGLCIEKVNMYGIPKAYQCEVFDAVNRTGLIRHTRGGVGADLEFSPAKLDKPAALDALLSHLGIRYTQVFAIGDSSTDVDVIRRAGVGVAMGNAPEEIKRAALFVTAPNTEDGFAQAVERLLLE